MAARKPPGMVFVSYARTDLARVTPLLTLLAKDFNTWWDRDIQLGHTWRQVLMQKLDAARCVVVLWTADSVHRDFIWSEIDRVKHRGIVVPVKLDANAVIPLGFDQMQDIDLTKWDGSRAGAPKALFARLRALLARPPPPRHTATIASEEWQLTSSADATQQLEHLTGEIGTLAGILVPGAGPVEDLIGALEEIHKTYASVIQAIGKFVAPAAERGKINPKPYLTMERGTLTKLIEDNRGHCTRILEYYDRVGGIRDWLVSQSNPSLLTSADDVFGQLATADGDMFDRLVQVGDVLTGEAREIGSFLLAGQENVARERILDGRKKLQPLEQSLSKAMLTLQRAGSSLGYVPGGKKGNRRAR